MIIAESVRPMPNNGHAAAGASAISAGFSGRENARREGTSDDSELIAKIFLDKTPRCCRRAPRPQLSDADKFATDFSLACPGMVDDAAHRRFGKRRMMAWHDSGPRLERRRARQGWSAIS